MEITLPIQIQDIDIENVDYRLIATKEKKCKNYVER